MVQLVAYAGIIFEVGGSRIEKRVKVVKMREVGFEVEEQVRQTVQQIEKNGVHAFERRENIHAEIAVELLAVACSDSLCLSKKVDQLDRVVGTHEGHEQKDKDPYSYHQIRELYL